MATPPLRRTPAHRGRRFAGAALVLALLLTGAGAGAAEAAGSKKPEEKFARFTAAWKGRSTKAIVGCMEPKGTVTLKLLTYPLSGKTRIMKPEQAKATLNAYFKRISGLKLKDVTPKKSPKNVRLYDFTYKPKSENARTTRLHVQLKQDKNLLWVLASVTESPKPRR